MGLYKLKQASKMNYLLLHRVTVIPTGDKLSLNKWRSEELPDVFFIKHIAGVQRNVVAGFDAVLLPSGASILVKEKAGEILLMLGLNEAV